MFDQFAELVASDEFHDRARDRSTEQASTFERPSLLRAWTAIKYNHQVFAVFCIYSEAVPRLYRGLNLCLEIFLCAFAFQLENALEYPDPGCDKETTRDDCLQYENFRIEALSDGARKMCNWDGCSASCDYNEPGEGDELDFDHMVLLTITLAILLPVCKLIGWIFDNVVIAPLPLDVILGVNASWAAASAGAARLRAMVVCFGAGEAPAPPAGAPEPALEHFPEVHEGDPFFETLDEEAPEEEPFAAVVEALAAAEPPEPAPPEAEAMERGTRRGSKAEADRLAAEERALVAGATKDEIAADAAIVEKITEEIETSAAETRTRILRVEAHMAASRLKKRSRFAAAVGLGELPPWLKAWKLRYKIWAHRARRGFIRPFLRPDPTRERRKLVAKALAPHVMEAVLLRHEELVARVKDLHKIHAHDPAERDRAEAMIERLDASMLSQWGFEAHEERFRQNVEAAIRKQMRLALLWNEELEDLETDDAEETLALRASKLIEFERLQKLLPAERAVYEKCMERAPTDAYDAPDEAPSLLVWVLSWAFLLGLVAYVIIYLLTAATEMASTKKTLAWLSDLCYETAFIYGVVLPIQILVLDTMLPSLLNERFGHLEDPTQIKVIPFHTRLPATATQFLLEKRPELRNTKIGKHILEKHPERHALLTAIDPAAIEHMYAEATWKPRPSTHLFLFFWAFLYGPLPGDIQDLIFEYLFTLSQPLANICGAVFGKQMHGTLTLVGSAFLLAVFFTVFQVAAITWDRAARRFKYLDVRNLLDDFIGDTFTTSTADSD
ncbi:calcium ion binding protein [Aureococcus anophagefferens]|nr:calcium ion binding protein [Aureococcus anophagefferens]